MSKPTPFRLAVNHLKSLGIIKRDNELLSVTGITSKGALSAYLGGKPPAHVVDKFLDKYGKHVRHFFTEEPEPEHHTTKKDDTDVRDHLSTLKNHNAFLQSLVKEKITAMESNLIAVLAGVAKQTIHFEAVSTTEMEALARLEKKKPDALIKIADKRVEDKLKSISEHHTDGINDKQHSS